MEKFIIDPNEKKRLDEKILEKIDPRLAEILQSHLTYAHSPEQEKKVEVPPEAPKDAPYHKNKGAGKFIESSLPEGDR